MDYAYARLAYNTSYASKHGAIHSEHRRKVARSYKITEIAHFRRADKRDMANYMVKPQLQIGTISISNITMLKLAQQGTSLLRTCRTSRGIATASRPARRLAPWAVVAGSATLLVSILHIQIMLERRLDATEESEGNARRLRK